jgi:hypothetical protein
MTANRGNTARQAATKEFEQEQTEKTERNDILIDSLLSRFSPVQETLFKMQNFYG